METLTDRENRQFGDQYQLRFPPGMRDQIKHRAEGNRRSMNGEIIAILDRALNEPEAPNDAS